MPSFKVCIAQCSYKGPHRLCFEDHLRFFFHLGELKQQGKFEFCQSIQLGNSLLGQARDLCIEAALEADADWIFFYDDDMSFRPEALEQLIANDKDVCAALAFTAREPIAPVIYHFKEKWDPKKRRVDVDIQPRWDYPRDQLFQVDAVGTGVFVAKTKVFERFGPPWFHGAVGCGEDIHFSFQARHKAEIWVDSRVKTHHVANAPTWMNEERYLATTNAVERAAKRRNEDNFTVHHKSNEATEIAVHQ